MEINMEGKIYLFLADGFEEIEALTVVDVLRRAGREVDMISVTLGEIVVGAHGISVLCDKNFMNCDFGDDPGMLVLPGGQKGALTLAEHIGLRNVLAKYAQKEWPIAAICAGPMVLGKMGLLKGRKAICYPGFEQYLTGAKIVNQSVVIDGNFITGRGPGSAFDFALAIVEFCEGKEKVAELVQSMCINR
jgi:4-methyl-5(b-hydroxyethyl)-thiazole monophosphate biosynthesis